MTGDEVSSVMFNAVQSAMMGAIDKIDLVCRQDGLKWAAKIFFLLSGAPTLTLYLPPALENVLANEFDYI